MKKVTFLISNSCNFRCRHCFVCAGKKRKDEIITEKKYTVIDNLKNLGVEKISFSGGEPLMDKNIFKYIEYAKNKNLKIGFLTNAVLLDREKINKLEELKIDSFSISLYTNDIIELDEEIYKSYIKKIIENLRLVSKTSLKYKITIPITNKNIYKIYKLLDLLIKNDIFPSMVRLYIITPVGRAKDNLNICTHNIDISNFFEKLPNEIKESKLNISIEYTDIEEKECKNNMNFTKCQLLNYKESFINSFGDPHMDVNGDLYLCGLLLRKKEFCIGNILYNTKEEIFNNIKKLTGRLEKDKKLDPCPILDREKKVGKRLVCPIIYEKIRK